VASVVRSKAQDTVASQLLPFFWVVFVRSSELERELWIRILGRYQGQEAKDLVLSVFSRIVIAVDGASWRIVD
jgi:hypothetical protein